MSMLGTNVVRKEDPKLLTVGGSYVDDLEVEGALHAVFVRSQVAHGTILSIETEDAASMPGVVAVYTAADLDLAPYPASMPMLNQQMHRTRLATERVRYVGEPVAVVIATSRTEAADAAEAVWVDVDPLPAVVSVHDSLANATLLFPDAGTNTVFAIPGTGADVFAGCDVTVDLSFRNHRLAPCPLEPRAAIARWDTIDGREHLTQWSENQGAHGTRDGLAGALGLEKDQVRVITPDVGGGFGAKNGTYPEDIVVAAAARRLGRPVRWLLRPDALGESKLLAWTHSDDHPDYLFVANCNVDEGIASFGIPFIPGVDPLEPWQCQFSTAGYVSETDQILISNGKHYKVNGLAAGEGRVYVRPH